MNSEKQCNICPRACRVDRDAGEIGYCGVGRLATVSHVAKHYYEEPPISGRCGSGTIFFGGCNLRCVYCQNRDISREPCGKTLDVKELSDLFLRVGESGAHNINLVTPTPYSRVVIAALERVKHRLSVPVVYNTSAYENISVIDSLSGIVDVYLPDLKYFSDELSVRYSNAKGYFDTAFAAIGRMIEQQGRIELDENGILKKGTVVRHLCLPSHSKDSEEVLRHLSCYLGKYDFRLSLMSQYTPDFLGERTVDYREIGRRITSLEYNRTLSLAETLGFHGYFQARDSASKKYTPDFDTQKFIESEEIMI